MATKRHSAPTIMDIARIAGTNRTSVSVVLNGGRSSSGVSEATRQRILSTARELDYRPNAIARSLLRRSTNVIGIYQGASQLDTHDPFYADIIRGLQIGCRELRKDLLLHTAFEGRETDAIYADLLNGKVDGLVLLMEPNLPLAKRLSASGFPMIALADPVLSIPCVMTDDAMGGRLQAEHLHAKGHRRVLYLTLPDPPASGKRRLAAFCDTTERLEMKVLVGEAPPDRVFLGEREKSWLTGPASERPTAVACWNDYCAHSLMFILYAMGVRVPDDLAVIGFDGFETFQLPRYYLTTIRTDWIEVGRRGVGLLVAMEADDVPVETIVPVELKLGDTT